MIEQYKTKAEEKEIDIMEYVVKLWNRRLQIIKWCVVGAVIGLVIGFSLPKSYYASVTLAPETQQKIGSGVSSIATMMGVTLDNSVDAISVEMFPDVVASTPFIYNLLDLPVTFVRKDSTMTTSLADYMMEYQKSPWWSHVMSAPFKLLSWLKSIGKEEVEGVEEELDPQNLPARYRSVVKALSRGISVSVDKRIGKISISLEMQDPRVVATVVDAVTNNLIEYMTNYRTSKVRQDVNNLTITYNQRQQDYYNAQKQFADYVDANQNVVSRSAMIEFERLQQEMNLAYNVYSQVAAQLEAARIKVHEAKPVFAILEPVCIPHRPCAPSKAKLLVVFTFLAFCASVAWILFGEDFKSKLTK